jgi:membrane protein
MKTGYFAIIQETISGWIEAKAFRLAAALAYYAIFSMAPLLVIAGSLAGLIFGEKAVQGHLDEQISSFVGQAGAETVQSMVRSLSHKTESFWASILGALFLFFGAGGVFGQLQDALNTIWEVRPKPGRGVIRIIRERFLSFAMVIVIGFLLLVSLVITTALSALTRSWEALYPFTATIWIGVNFLLSFLVSSVLFLLMFKYLPDVRLRWKEVIPGAIVTALLFDIGKSGLGVYLGRESLLSSYGAAGAVVVLLLWVYYASLIFLLGAEFTHVWIRHKKRRVACAPSAEKMTKKQRIQEGLSPLGRKSFSPL